MFKILIVTLLQTIRMMIIGILICLIILTSQCVHSKVIIVNNNNGNDNTECCVNGECTCSSLSTALLNIDNNTIINITSESIALNNTTTMGSGKLTNITITGSNVTIMCNNIGSVYCESCDDVMIEGITWDRCGDPNGRNVAGVTFYGTSNISLVNCTFQNSQLPTLSLLQVSYNILIQGCNFMSNNFSWEDNFTGVLNISRESSHGLSSLSNITVTVTINEGYFYSNTCPDISSLNIYINDTSSVANCSIIVNKTTFVSNQVIFNLTTEITKSIIIQLSEISAIKNSHMMGLGVIAHLLSATGDVFLSIFSSNFNGNNGSNVWCDISGNTVTVQINNSSFTDSRRGNISLKVPAVYLSTSASNASEIMFQGVQVINNVIEILPAPAEVDVTAAVSIVANRGNISINMFLVNFTSNRYLGLVGGALAIVLSYENGIFHNILINGCNFVSNRSPSYGAALYIDTRNDHNIQIVNTTFDQNIGGSTVYLKSFMQQPNPLKHNQPVIIKSSNFTNNIGSSIYLSSRDVKLSGNLLFKNNTAENGGAMYVDQETTVTIDDEASVKFIANTAKVNGGAIFVNLVCGHIYNGVYKIINTFESSSNNAVFINNSAKIVDNALYFNVPRPLVIHMDSRQCTIKKDVNDRSSILHIPCQFNYSQPVNGKMMNIPCDLDYTLLNGTGAPIITSPCELRLYFPFSDGYKISSTSDSNVYFVRNHILGHPVKFTGAVFDYFGKPTEPTQYDMQLQCSQNSECLGYTLMSDNHNYILTHTIDNSTILNVNLKGKLINTAHMNLTVTLTALSYSINSINAALVVELVPCIDHPGYAYGEESKTCICYHYNVKCSDDGNEIKRGYWFGSIASIATTSLCPNHYCKFTDRKQTSEGYFELSNSINEQCNDHRVGRTCGECSLGYTLSYDSTDCIDVDQCGTGWTVLVITLTCLYWIAVVVGVFSLMYFRFQISLGYLHGLIYYYSMVGILLNNNPYVSDDAFQFVSILSSFAQLTPQFLGKLCLLKGLSGIDQLFIHYSHAVGVSLLLLFIVVSVRHSARMSLFVSRCIIRVVCLLTLLSYTSIASTSLQLLLPLRFTDIKEWYTYSSPNIQYFHGRHIIYGIVAIISEIVVGIGLPLLLLFEPVLSKKINFIKIKPLLDQFQGCYKDKYRWFAAFYLICRQIIFLPIYIFNSDYSNMLFYLQTACVVIAMIHMWIQPYQNEFLNAFDGVILLCIVLEVNINTFPFLKSLTTEVSIMTILFPLSLLSFIAIKKVIHFCLMKWHHRHYDPINGFVDDKRDSDVVIRYVCGLELMY